YLLRRRYDAIARSNNYERRHNGSEGRMAEERFPRRDFLKVTASTALTFGATLPATAQPSASAPPSRRRHLQLLNLPPSFSRTPTTSRSKRIFRAPGRLPLVASGSSPAARMRQWRRMPHQPPASSI